MTLWAAGEGRGEGERGKEGQSGEGRGGGGEEEEGRKGEYVEQTGTGFYIRSTVYSHSVYNNYIYIIYII